MGVLVQLHQVSVYRPRLLPLFQDDYPHFVPHPLRELLKKFFHAADSEIVDPASDDLVELGKRHIQWTRHRVLPSEPFPNLGVQPLFVDDPETSPYLLPSQVTFLCFRHILVSDYLDIACSDSHYSYIRPFEIALSLLWPQPTPNHELFVAHTLRGKETFSPHKCAGWASRGKTQTFRSTTS